MKFNAGKAKLLLCFLSIGSLVISCATPLYSPDFVQVSTLTEKGEVELDVSTGSSGLNLGLAVAVTNNIGIQAKFCSEKKGDVSSTYRSKRSYFDAGAGYTNTLGDSDARLIYSCFAGLGRGKAMTKYKPPVGGSGGSGSLTTVGPPAFVSVPLSRSSDGTCNKLWIQPSVGVDLNFIELIFATRVSYLNFKSLNNKLGSNPLSVNENGRFNTILYEPTLTMRIGSERVKGKFQYGKSLSHFSSSELRFSSKDIIFSLGIMFQLQ